MDHGRRSRERQVGHHPVRPPGQRDKPQIGLHDRHVGRIGEMMRKAPRVPPITFHGDDPRATPGQRPGQGSQPGAEIEDQIVAPDPGAAYQVSG